MTVEFRLLGDIEVRIDGCPVEVGHARQRCVLAVLLVDAARVVSIDQLVDRVWGEHLPQRPRHSLYGYISRLRQALMAASDVSIVRQSGGYVLAIDAMAVDLHRFRDLVAQARTTDNDERAGTLFKQALELWRGEAFATLDTPWLNTLRDTVEAERFAAELDRNDLDLRRGRHSELLARLPPVVAAHPLDERLAGQLILALYRCGRQADALDHYQQIRLRLAEELGTDPTPPLRELHQQVLTAAPSLAVPATAGITPRAVPSPVLRQLPAPPQLFTGRTRELAELDRIADAENGQGATMLISAIGGIGGIGKTWLVVRWAHDNLERFPDGQLYVNLRGFDPTGEPLPAATAIRGFLDALGVDPASVPADLDGQAALYRSLIAGKRMLIVLDNARDTPQMTPLLPGTSTATVLVTSRHQLAGLLTTHGARPITLDLLSQTEARQLITRHLGHTRLAAEPEAVTDLLAQCGGLPLALSIMAARAAARPDFPLSVLADELREAPARLDALDAGELTANLRAVFSSSYRALDARPANMFGLLGLAPGPDIGLAGAASLAARSTSSTRTTLRELHRAHLVQEHRPGRYRMHDLVRLYAVECAVHDQSQQGRDAALRRLVDFYLHTAYAGDRLLYPHRPPIELDPPAPGCVPQPLHDRATAMAWFDTNHACLLATHHLTLEQHWDTPAWKLPWALTIFHWRRGHLHHHFAAWQAGLTAAERLGDPAPRAHAHRFLGHAHGQAGSYSAAQEHLQQALTLSEQSADTFGQGHTHQLLAWISAEQGDHQRALTHATQTLRLARALANPVWIAIALDMVGAYLARLGHHQHARTYCEQALTLHSEHHHREGEADTLNSLGYIAHHTGQHTQALRYYHHALALRRDLGDAYAEAETLEQLGHAHRALGQHAEARHAWHQALDLYHTQHRTQQAKRAHEQLDTLNANSP